jgi:hypothetical protein
MDAMLPTWMASKTVLRFFDFANYKRKTVGYLSSMRYNDSVGDCPAEICELFADLFKSAYNVDTCDTEDVSDPSDGCGFSGIRLRMSDLEAAIQCEQGTRKWQRSSFLCADGLKSPLLHIFNLSLSTGTFPSKWKDSFLIPIFKTGKRYDVGNYRGVAIFSCFAKLFEVRVYDYIFFSVKSSIMSAQYKLVSPADFRKPTYYR